MSVYCSYLEIAKQINVYAGGHTPSGERCVLPPFEKNPGNSFSLLNYFRHVYFIHVKRSLLINDCRKVCMCTALHIWPTVKSLPEPVCRMESEQTNCPYTCSLFDFSRVFQSHVCVGSLPPPCISCRPPRHEYQKIRHLVHV